MEQVILVNEKDEQIGTMEKMEAHMKAVLHRAFSIFVFNNKGEMLLQQRALNKYHSGGLWTNACCSHPRPGEETAVAAQRRLQEELGFSTPLEKAFEFSYNAPFNNGLTENEYDHVFIGKFEGKVNPVPSEVQDFCYKKIEDISSSLESHPSKYTAWFHIAYPRVVQWINEKNI